MTRNRRTAPVFWGVLLVSVAAGAAAVEDAAPQPAPAADPDHLWNRLRAGLHVRMESEQAPGADRPAFDPDEHDPLFWSRISFPEPVDYLFHGVPYREAIALLDEFLMKNGEKLVADPLQRALLQHDLWAAFDYVSDPEWSDPLRLQPGRKQYRAERRELARRLSAAIHRLALTGEQVGTLPDNYAAAVAAKAYPPAFDPERPGRAFLPADLWDPAGPWVLVGEWANNPLAIRHTAFFGGRSTFVVFLRLPAGRAATQRYLKDLREWKPKPGEALPPDGRAVPPQVPPRTMFALARRMTVVDAAGELAPTRLTESVQVRVLPDPAAPGGQTFLEFRLRRRDLAAGMGGGLTAVRADERDRTDVLDLGPRNDREKREPVLASCRTCHTDQGILSMNSYTGSLDNVSRQRGARALTDSTLKHQADAAVAWKQARYSWGLLNGYWGR